MLPIIMVDFLQIKRANNKRHIQSDLNISLSPFVSPKFGCLEMLLSCQPKVTVTSCFAYKVIRDI